MKTLRQIIEEAQKNKVAIGHFNISETSRKHILKGYFEV